MLVFKFALGDLTAREEEPSGVLRVTRRATWGPMFLAEAVTRFTVRYPAAPVDLHLTGRTVDLVAEGFDLALRVASSLADSTLMARRISWSCSAPPAPAKG